MASSSTNKFQQEVFMSFNGKHIGMDFADYVYIALGKKGFKVYTENDGMEHDERTRKKLYNAIEKSQLSIVIISTEYVKSPWCLDELVKILNCRNSHGHTVLPVFYNHMEIIQVAEQSGKWCEEAFAEHEKLFHATVVKKWRSALAEVATLAVKGLSLRETNWYSAPFHRYSAPLRQKIIEEVWKIIGPRHLEFSLDIYGSEATAQSIRNWIEDVVKIWNQSQVK